MLTSAFIASYKPSPDNPHVPIISHILFKSHRPRNCEISGISIVSKTLKTVGINFNTTMKYKDKQSMQMHASMI